MNSLRQLTSKANLLLASAARSSSSSFSTQPTVFDKIVQFTIIDKLGRRHTIRGLEGQTIVDVLESRRDTFGDDALALGPEGHGTYEAHIKLPNELLATYPPPQGHDNDFLYTVADQSDLDKHSRLASKVVLTQEMNGAPIALGSLAPWLGQV
jgi:hypothetical protein